LPPFPFTGTIDPSIPVSTVAAHAADLRLRRARPVRHVFLLPSPPTAGRRSLQEDRDRHAGSGTGEAAECLHRIRHHARPRACTGLVFTDWPVEPVHAGLETA